MVVDFRLASTPSLSFSFLSATFFCFPALRFDLDFDSSLEEDEDEELSELLASRTLRFCLLFDLVCFFADLFLPLLLDPLRLSTASSLLEEEEEEEDWDCADLRGIGKTTG